MSAHAVVLEASEYYEHAIASERAVSKHEYLSGSRDHTRCYQRLQTTIIMPLPVRELSLNTCISGAHQSTRGSISGFKVL